MVRNSDSRCVFGTFVKKNPFKIKASGLVVTNVFTNKFYMTLLGISRTIIQQNIYFQKQFSKKIC